MKDEEVRARTFLDNYPAKEDLEYRNTVVHDATVEMMASFSQQENAALIAKVDEKDATIRNLQEEVELAWQIVRDTHYCDALERGADCEICDQIPLVASEALKETEQ